MSTPLEVVIAALGAKGCNGFGRSWQCPAHEDRRASLSILEGSDGKVLLRCFAGCEVEAIVPALGLEMTDLFPPKEKRPTKLKVKTTGAGVPPWERPIRTTYPYHDKVGNLLFEIVRFDDEAGEKCRPRFPDPKGWSWKAKKTERPLYRLPELQKALEAGRTVYIPEGEKDVETLRALGLEATTNPGGAEGWKKAYAEDLVDADVILTPDNDDPGRKRVEKAARSLHGKAKRVRILTLPDLPPKGDVSDWLAAGGTIEELEKLAAEAPEWTPGVDDEGSEATRTKGGGDEEEREPSCAAQLTEIGRKSDLFHDERGDGYTAFTEGSVRRVMKVRSSDFASELCRRFAEKYDFKKVATGEALAAARSVIEALARHKNEEHRLSTRFARHDGAVWIDMADPRWRAIRVTPGRWEIVDTPPLLFRRYPHMRPLPEPVRGGDLAQLFEPFALGEAEKILLTAYVVTIPLGDIPRPLLLPHGPQGSGKTTLLKRILATIDPSGIDDLDLGGEPRELAQLLDQHAVAFFDNVVRIGEASARLLCKAATGGGFEKRRLFTDEESIILTFKRAVMVSAINVPTHAPDLLDRCLLLPLDRIPPENRCLEADLWRTFDAQRPAILGGLLDALAAAMAVYPTLKHEVLPRMADFAAWGAAVSDALGLDLKNVEVTDGFGRSVRRDLHGAEAFLHAYRENVSRQTEEVIEADPVARAVVDLVHERKTWTGSSSELFTLMKARYGEEMKVKESGWPKLPNGLSRRLGVLHSTLADAGIAVTWDRSKKSRTVTLAVETPKSSSPSSSRHQSAPGAVREGDDTGDDARDTVTHTVTRKPAQIEAGDDGDDSDGTFLDSTAAPGRKVANL